MTIEGTPRRLLVVDDDPQMLRILSRLLAERGFAVRATLKLEEVLEQCRAREVDAIVLDHSLDDVTSAQAIPRIRAIDPTVAVVVLSGAITVAESANAIRQGAEDVQSKPPDLELLQAALERGLQRTALLRARALMVSQVVDPYGLFDPSPAMQRVLRQIEQVALRHLPVLLVGEPGTGKRVLAELVHQLSPRSGAPFRSVALSGRDDEAVEQALTALMAKARDDQALGGPGGTIYLDELGILTPRQQLLLQELLGANGAGTTHTGNAPPRILASTRRDLSVDVRAGRLSGSLYQRLAVIPITVPALRERGAAAVRVLAERVRKRLQIELGEGPDAFRPDALDWLGSLPWPDNIPQLRDVVEESFARAIGETDISAAHLTPSLIARGLHAGRDDASTEDWSLRQAEKRHIASVVAMSGGNRAQAARLLGITRTTLYKKMAEFGLSAPTE